MGDQNHVSGAIDMRLRAIERKVDHISKALDGNGDAGLRDRVRALDETVFGGTARVPHKESLNVTVRDLNNQIRDFRTILRVLQWIAGFFGLTTIGGLLYVIGLLRQGP